MAEIVTVLSPCIRLCHACDRELGFLHGIQWGLPAPGCWASISIQMELFGPQGPLTPDGHAALPGVTEPGSAQTVDLGRVPGRKSEAWARFSNPVPSCQPQDPPSVPHLSARIFSSPSYPQLPVGRPLVPHEEWDLGHLGIDSPASSGVLRLTLSPGREILWEIWP